MAKHGAEVTAMSKHMAGTSATADKEQTQMKYDADAVAKRFKELNEEVANRKAAEKANEDKLAAVHVAPSDVTLVSEQLGLTAAEATRFLRVHGGDVKRAFQAFIDG